MKYYRFAIALPAAAASVLLLAGMAFAQSNPAMSTASTTLFENIKLLFNWVIAVAAVIAALSFAVGAIQFMFMGNGEGKDRMFGSFVGLALSLGAIVVLQTINPQIIQAPNITALPAVGGVYLEKTNKDLVPAELSFHSKNLWVAPEPGKAKEFPYQSIFYNCEGLDVAKTPRLIIAYAFQDGDIDRRYAYQISCDERFDISNLTHYQFSLAFEYPGVYFYTGANCSGGGDLNSGQAVQYTGPHTTHVSTFPIEFANQIKCMIFYTGGLANGNWEVYPSQVPGLINEKSGDIAAGPPCASYESEGHERTPLPIRSCAASIKSALVFRIPDNPNQTGNLVTFYSKPGFAADAGQATYDFTAIGEGIATDPGDIEFQYANPIPEEDDNPENREAKNHQAACKTFKDCPGSIKTVGGYLVILDSREEDPDSASANSSLHTKFFSQSAVDLGKSPGALDPIKHPDFWRIVITPIIQ